MPRRLSIVAAFDQDTCQRIAASAPDRTRYYTDANHQILYAETPAETWVSAARWHIPVEELADLYHQEGPGYSYTSPAAFAFSRWRADYAPPGYALWDSGFLPDMAHAALYGGRCEVYRYLDGEPAHQYDITSAYPYASTQLQFPDPRSLRYAKPATIANIWMYEGVSRVVFSQDADYPILPIRHGGRIIYPVGGELAGTYTHTELRYALHHCPAVVLHTVTKQYIAMATTRDNPFRSFVEYCYERRVTTGRKLWKVIANALFGRLAVAGAGLWTFTPTRDLAAFRGLPQDARGWFGLPCVGRVSHAPPRGNVLWAAMVLAQARCALHSYLTPDTVYVDTDCLFCSAPQALPLSEGIGGWKYQFGRYHIRGTQAYQRVDPATGEITTKLRGVARATRKEADFFRAQTTQERVRLPDGRTVPHVLEGHYA